MIAPLNILLHFVFFCIVWNTVSPAGITRKEAFWRDPNRPTIRTQRNLSPQTISDRYDSNTIALDLDAQCLHNKTNSNPDDILANLMEDYPCLGYKNDESTIFYYHGDIYRIYLNIIDGNSLCLETKQINWDDYCIYDINYDMILNMHNQVICASDIINNIIYSNKIIKPYAWELDIIDLMKDGKYKKPSIEIGDGNDHGIDIWILDSGINENHNEFIKGQIINEDNNFNKIGIHGTATSSCASGINYGTSKGFNIHDYPVCRSIDGCAFNDIDIGLHKVLNHMMNTNRRSVINLSLGSNGVIPNSYWGLYYDSLFNDIINQGGIIVVSAGNDNADACSYWFSYSNHTISVGAHDSALRKASYSNYGNCVDIYAPGTSIPVAASLTDNSLIAYMSGTSFAAPLITGIITNLLYEDNSRTKDEIVAILQSNAVPIMNCPSGYCYAATYQCQDSTSNDVSTSNNNNQILQTSHNPTPLPSHRPTHSPTLIPTKSNGCCISIKHTARLDRYCKSVPIHECESGRNPEYCYLDYSESYC